MPNYANKQSKTNRANEAATAVGSSPGKHTLVEQAYAPTATVQRRSAENGAPAVHASAARGTATPASALPHGDRIQRAFGRHDISSVQAHVGGDAAASATEMGADAYATGNHIVLGKGADLFTEAHEAAHVVHQRGGVQLKGGVGEDGDQHERHADEVASLVVQGKSAEGLLDQVVGPAMTSGPATGGETQHWIQRKAGGGTDPAAQNAHDDGTHLDFYQNAFFANRRFAQTMEAGWPYDPDLATLWSAAAGALKDEAAGWTREEFHQFADRVRRYQLDVMGLTAKEAIGVVGDKTKTALRTQPLTPRHAEAKPEEKPTPTPVAPPATVKRPSGEPPKARYMNFIADAARYGMPVKFLEAVAKAYTIKEVAADEDNVTKPWTSTIEFRPGVLADGSLNAANAGMSSEVSTVYHESTHAYLRGLMLNQEPFKTMISEGIKHYTGALTADGKANSDPERVFHEAAAEYVDNRMGTWWKAFTTLNTYAAAAKLTTARIDQQRKDYDANMARRTFGYSEEGLLAKKQTDTTEPITLAIKTFLDHELLEDKIPERFDDVAAFQDVIKSAQEHGQK